MIKEIQKLRLPIIPANDHPLRTEFAFSRAIMLAEFLGELMVDIEDDDIDVVFHAINQAFMDKCNELKGRLNK